LRKNSRAKLLRTLFTSTFTLSAFTFGGGYVIVPLMRKRFVEQLGWIDEQEMLDLIAIAQSAPGIIAVNTSILVGYKVAGVGGAVFTLLGTMLPPLL
jgi:chromate transporter